MRTPPPASHLFLSISFTRLPVNPISLYACFVLLSLTFVSVNIMQSLEFWREHHQQENKTRNIKYNITYRHKFLILTAIIIRRSTLISIQENSHLPHHSPFHAHVYVSSIILENSTKLKWTRARNKCGFLLVWLNEESEVEIWGKWAGFERRVS